MICYQPACPIERTELGRQGRGCGGGDPAEKSRAPAPFFPSGHCRKAGRGRAGRGPGQISREKKSKRSVGRDSKVQRIFIQEEVIQTQMEDSVLIGPGLSGCLRYEDLPVEVPDALQRPEFSIPSGRFLCIQRSLNVIFPGAAVHHEVDFELLFFCRPSDCSRSSTTPTSTEQSRYRSSLKMMFSMRWVSSCCRKFSPAFRSPVSAQ